ncbi:MAG TPA: phage tail protein, partial [Rhodospirillaceae bacterium]|nr:phage tail protein [Rhodospirillaceae bacterium]
MTKTKIKSSAVKLPQRHDPKLETLMAEFSAAREERRNWENIWQDCYEFVLPYRNAFASTTSADRKYDRVFDATAADAVDQLAASLLAQLTPPWSRWFGFRPGPALSDTERDQIGPVLEEAQLRLQSHFDRSNFAVEMHQAYLDLVTAGTGSIAFEESAPGEYSAFRFTAVPLADLVLDEGIEGRLNVTFRQMQLTAAQIAARYPNVELPPELIKAADRRSDKAQTILEYVQPDGKAYEFGVIWQGGGAPELLLQKRLGQSPFMHFRWLKSPGETYGRSPVMKALPDIKTANKVVELILKNASIAVTGIWQADDDGVLNPANIKLVPGAIIPKAVGSAGLTPLGAPGRFDVSQLMLDDLRRNIRRALLVDQLGQPQDYRMTATEVLQRATEMARILGATYGRLQSELLTPMILRGMHILQRRGEIPFIPIDGRTVELHYSSPLALAQSQRDGQSILSWLTAVQAMGAGAQTTVNPNAIVKFLADMYGVPASLMQLAPETQVNAVVTDLAAAAKTLTQTQ